jgi:hypothetical protein
MPEGTTCRRIMPAGVNEYVKNRVGFNRQLIWAKLMMVLPFLHHVSISG